MKQPRRISGLFHPMGGAMDVLARSIVLSCWFFHHFSIWAFPAKLGSEAEIFWKTSGSQKKKT
jgi:hypothetical protein